MKPATYTQIYLQLIFSPKYREALLNKEQRNVLYPYIGKTLVNLGHTPLGTNGMADHIHILVSLNPNQSVSNMVRDIKRSSSGFINDEKWFRGKFQWQDGYGAFSYGRSQLLEVRNYIVNQEYHHGKRTFKEEYTTLLKLFEIEFKEQYLFDFHE